MSGYGAPVSGAGRGQQQSYSFSSSSAAAAPEAGRRGGRGSLAASHAEDAPGLGRGEPLRPSYAAAAPAYGREQFAAAGEAEGFSEEEYDARLRHAPPPPSGDYRAYSRDQPIGVASPNVHVTNNFPSPLSTYLASCLDSIVATAKPMVKNTFLGVPILISGGIAAGAVNHLASIRYPRFAAAELSKDTGIFVGLAYLFHMALAPLVHSLIPFGRALQQGHASAEEKAFEVRKRILSYAIQYFNPVVLTLYAAHKLGLKLDHAKALLYTAGIFTSIRLLGELLNWSLKWGFAEESGGHASVISNSEHRD